MTYRTSMIWPVSPWRRLAPSRCFRMQMALRSTEKVISTLRRLNTDRFENFAMTFLIVSKIINVNNYILIKKKKRTYKFNMVQFTIDDFDCYS